MNKHNRSIIATTKYVKSSSNYPIFSFLCCICLFASFVVYGFGQTADIESNDPLIDQYVHSLGKEIIVFDASNIKQYWIDHSVLSTDKNTINIHLTQKQSGVFESIPLMIQLANVNEAQLCRIEILTDSPDTVFWITDSNSKRISSSLEKDLFLEYEKTSLLFNLEDVQNFSFYVNFSNPKKDIITIKKVILSFSKSQTSHFLASPGKILITKDNVTTTASDIVASGNNSFVITGERINIVSKNKILVSNNTLTLSAKIRNISGSPAAVYVGYQPYTKDGKRIHNRNNPYNGNNTILKIVSCEKDRKRVVVDSYPEWQDGCFLAFDAKEDLSDFPNFNLSEGKIVDVKKTSENRGIITFDKPLRNIVKEGTSVRIQSPHGVSYLYVKNKTLQPGEEIDFSSSLQRDDSFLEFSPKALSRGVYYVIPVILIRYANSNPENKCQITNFTVSY